MRTVSKNFKLKFDVTGTAPVARQDGGEIADGSIACLVALSSFFAK
jgi:hypothetical protein